MIRVGLVGCGGIMGAHLPGWRAVAERAQVTACCDTNEENAKRRAGEIGIDSVCSDWKQLLRDNSVDAVDLCLPHKLHRDAIIDAAVGG